MAQTLIKQLFITIFMITALLVNFVKSHCSELHRETCSWSYIRLQLVSSKATSTTQYVLDVNATTLKYACELYHDYSNCSQPFLSSCDTATLEEIHSYDTSFSPVCGDLLENCSFSHAAAHLLGYIEHRRCFQRLYRSYSTCQKNRSNFMRTVDRNSSAYRFMFCSSSKDYVTCLYTATALGCSMQAADVYFNILKRSLSLIFKAEGFTCLIRHPLDVISVYTTTPSTTTDIQTISASTDKSRDSEMLARGFSNCSRHSPMQCLYFLVCLLLNLIYFSVT